MICYSRIVTVLINEILKLALIDHLKNFSLNLSVLIWVTNLGQKSALISEQTRNINFRNTLNLLIDRLNSSFVSNFVQVFTLSLISQNVSAKISRIYRDISRGYFRPIFKKRIIIFLINHLILKWVQIVFIRETYLLLNVLILDKWLGLVKLISLFVFYFGQRETIWVLQCSLVLQNIILVSSIRIVGSHPISLEDVLLVLFTNIQNLKLLLRVISPIMKILPKGFSLISRFEYIPDLLIKHNDYYWNEYISNYKRNLLFFSLLNFRFTGGRFGVLNESRMDWIT